MPTDDAAEVQLVPSDPWQGPLLEAKDIVAGYVPEVNILNGCNLSLQNGELVGVIGPNGAGKSTLLKALFGLIPIRGGSVVLRGEDISGKRAHALVSRGLGYVPQTNNVFPSLTVQENLEMGMYQRPREFHARFERHRNRLGIGLEHRGVGNGLAQDGVGGILRDPGKAGVGRRRQHHGRLRGKQRRRRCHRKARHGQGHGKRAGKSESVHGRSFWKVTAPLGGASSVDA